jgi:hypothetical protein
MRFLTQIFAGHIKISTTFGTVFAFQKQTILNVCIFNRPRTTKIPLKNHETCSNSEKKKKSLFTE